MKPISEKDAYDILERLSRGTSIDTIAARTNRFNAHTIRCVLRHNPFSDDAVFTDAWQLMQSKRRVNTPPRTMPVLWQLEDRQIEAIFQRRLQGETYAVIAESYHMVSEGYIGSLCGRKPPRPLNKRCQALWAEIQDRREALDGRRGHDAAPLDF